MSENHNTVRKQIRNNLARVRSSYSNPKTNITEDMTVGQFAYIYLTVSKADLYEIMTTSTKVTSLQDDKYQP